MKRFLALIPFLASCLAAQINIGGSNIQFGNAGTSPKKLYASAACHGNSNVATGGGTSDTVCVQNGLNALGSAGGGIWEQDVPSLIDATNYTGSQLACLLVPSNVHIHFSSPTTGFYLASASNCTMISNSNITGNPAATFDHDIIIDGPGVINQNEGGQSKFEKGVSSNGWNYALFFMGVNNLTVNDVTILKCPTFFITFGNGAHFRSRNVFLNQPGSHGAGNHDGFHIYGTWDDAVIENAIVNVDDAGVGMVTDEAVSDYNAGVITPFFGYQRFSWSGGATTNIKIDHFYMNTAGYGIEVFSYLTTNGVSHADNIVLRNIFGTAGAAGLLLDSPVGSSDFVIGTLVVDGWHLVKNGFNVMHIKPPTGQASFFLTLNDITPLDNIDYSTSNPSDTATTLGGNFFSTAAVVAVGTGTLSPQAVNSITFCTSTCGVNPPPNRWTYPATEWCVLNDTNVSTQISVLGATGLYYQLQALTGYTTVGHGLISSGAVGDKICLVQHDLTHLNIGSISGTWTMIP